MRQEKDSDRKERKAREGPAIEYTMCLKLRRLAKRALLVKDLAERRHKQQHAARIQLLEAVWDYAGELDVWECGTAKGLAVALLYIYEAEDEDAAEVLNGMADEELKALRDREEGVGDDG